MSRSVKVALYMLVPLLTSGAAAAAGPLTRVTVANGRVNGTLAGDVAVFRGIPYAAPPTGAMRWRPPASPAAWHGTLQADHFAADCPSALPPLDTIAATQSEDCLYLNVWTAAHSRAERLPVMVWLYGSGFLAGSASSPRFDGSQLARRGVVLVSMNVRGGVLGFLTHPWLSAESPRHVSGNYGLLDALAALGWVQRNIAAFGGDPQRVTVFGQSSGSESVNILTASPLSKGLIQRAIGESGGAFGQRQPKSLQQSEVDGVAYTARLGAATLDGLRALSTAQLFAARPPRFEPVIDGWLVPSDLYSAYGSGRQNDVPTLLGSNADEAQLSATLKLEEYQAQLRERFGNRSAEALQRFPAEDDATARVAAKSLGTLLLGDFNTSTWARLQTRSSHSAVYQYRFTRTPPTAAGTTETRRGAYHGAEISYVFDNLARDSRPWSALDHELARTMSSYWINFARTGNPNGPGLPDWASLRQQPDQVMEFGDEVRITPRPHGAELEFLTDLFYGPAGLFGR